MSSKGPNFSPEEDYALAKSWVSASQSTSDMKSEQFWAEVLKRFNSQEGVMGNRTSGSLETRWRTVSRVSQKYLAADKTYRSVMHSGETEEDIRRNVMKVYREQNKYKDKGVLRTPGVIKFMDAVWLLSKYPKFSTRVGGSSKSAQGSVPGGAIVIADDIEGIGEDGSGNIGMGKPSESRPKGVKKRKIEEKREQGTSKVASSVEKMAQALKQAAIDKRRTASLALQFEIMKSMPMSDAERYSKMESLRMEAAAMYGVESAHESPSVVQRQPVQSSNGGSSSLMSAPSGLVRGPNSSSFHLYSERDDASNAIETDDGSNLTN